MYVTKFPCSFNFFENSSMFPPAYAKILRYFAHSKLCFIEVLLPFLNFRFPRNISLKVLRIFEEHLKKDHEISFEISLKIRENKGRILTNFALITFAQYCIHQA